MSNFMVTPDELEMAAKAISGLGRTHHTLPTETAAGALAGSATAAALERGRTALIEAEDVISGRYRAITSAVTVSAFTYHWSDAHFAQRLAALADVG
ncbi:MAG: hypothetical protein WBF79_03485 [Rhodococcus sp. (in: high G+C Gram-positive bacteria)]